MTGQNEISRNFRAAVYLIADYNGRVPLLMRSGAVFMTGYWTLIAGRVEPNERYLSAIIREAKEEGALDLASEDVRLVHVCDRYQVYDQNNAKVNWCDIYFYVKNPVEKPINNEPRKHSGLEWFSLDDLPENLLPYTKYALGEYLKGNNYSEYGFE